MEQYWVNLSKRGGKDGVLRGLAGLLQGISRGRILSEIPWSSPDSPRKTLSFPTLLLRFILYFQHNFSKYWGQQASKFFWMLFQLTSDDKKQILKQLVQNIFFHNFFCKTPVKSCKKAIKDCDDSWTRSWVEYHIFSWDQLLRAF